MKNNLLNRALLPLYRRLRLLVNRGVTTIVNDELKQQNLQIKLLANEVADDVERFQNYGVTSVPPVGSEAIVLSVGGKRQHLVAIAVDNKNTRLKKLKAGDSAMYHQEGHYIKLAENGLVEIHCKSLTIKADEIVFDSPQTRFTGNVDIVGNSSANDHQSGGISGNKHTHTEHDGARTSTPQ